MAGVGIKIGIASAVIVIGLGISFYSIDNIQNPQIITQTVNISEIQQISHTLGADSAPIKLIEFGDYQCPFCGEWFQEMKPLFDENYISTGKAQFIFVDYPFLGADSYPTAHASFCAEEQNLYWEFHEIVFVQQGVMNDGWANKDNIRALSEQSGLDMEQYDTCMSELKYENKLNRNIAIGDENNVNQTPTFLIVSSGEQQKIEGKQPIDVFDQVIQEML